MVKNFLKRTLCIALSFAMMTGGVFVKASPVQKKQLEEIARTDKIILKDKVVAKKIQRAIQNDSNTVRNANLFYDLTSFNKIYADLKTEIVAIGLSEHKMRRIH